MQVEATMSKNKGNTGAKWKQKNQNGVSRIGSKSSQNSDKSDSAITKER